MKGLLLAFAIVTLSGRLNIVGAKGGGLSSSDTLNYIYCADRLDRIIENAGPNTFNVIMMPPKIHVPDVTYVTVSFDILQLHEIRDDQVLSVTGMVTFRWQDDRLVINDPLCANSSAQFTVIHTRGLVWYPQWTISNGHGTVLGEESWQYNPAIVYADGSVTWKVSFYFLTECPLNVKLFPFDVQQCSIDITSPHYGSATLKYVADEKLSITAHNAVSLQSPVWRIVGQKATEVSSQYPSMSFRLLVKRRPGFYNVALICPTVVVNIVMVYTFLLPAIQEEKTSTASAAVLAYFFVEMMFYEFVPMSSDNIPGLIIFFTIQTFLAVIAYLVECRLIKFAEETEREKIEATDPFTLLGIKTPKKILEEEERERKRGPFDGLSPDYINDWCLVSYVAAVALSYFIAFIYLPVKAQATQDAVMASGYADVRIE